MRQEASTRGIALAVAVLLAAATMTVFSPAWNHEFILYDDPSYVTENATVRSGLTWSGAVWAFTTTFTGNWHPLTWLSHMADVELFGLDAKWHHAMNILLHVANTMLLLGVLYAMTGLIWRSAMVAALFALHPLHVESVAWIAERKDVLSALFWMLALGAYVGYVRNPGLARWLLVAVSFTLGLLAKPMVVTLPFVLLLLDYWPLERYRDVASPTARFRGLVWEKLPLFGLAAVASAATIYAQRAGGNVAEMEHLPFATRVASSLDAYLRYLGKAVWPRDLAAFYPHPASLPGSLGAWDALVAGVVLVAISGAAVWLATSRRYLIVGWLWFLGTLVPVIGLVQVGQQGIADRYTYLPLVGLFIAVVWGLADAVPAWPARRRVLVLIGTGGLATMAFLTWVQVGYWRDTVTLFEHALRATGTNRVAHLQLGAAYARQGRYDEAAVQYRAALAMKANSVEANNNLGIVLARSGRPAEAADAFRVAVAIQPGDARLHANLARALRQTGAIPQAVEHYREAVRLDPARWDVSMNLAWILATDLRVHGAVEAVALAEDANRRSGGVDARALDTLGAAYAAAGRYVEAVEAAHLALAAALRSNERQLAVDIEARVARYRSGQPHRVMRSGPP